MMPITEGSSRGFNPVYVYSHAKKTRPPKDKKSYSQAKQGAVVIALNDADDADDAKKKVATGSHTKYFVDLASNDAVWLSNSLLLEKNGWKGICLEPNPRAWYDLASYRSCTVIGAFVGGLQQDDGKEVDVQFLDGMGGGIAGDGFDNKTGSGNAKRNLVSIVTVLQETDAPKIIDYFSLDVEGAETFGMDQFPWETYKVKFISIERPKDDLIQILEANGYEKATDITYWGETLWVNKEVVALTKEEINAVIDEKDLRCTRCTGEKRTRLVPPRREFDLPCSQDGNALSFLVQCAIRFLIANRFDRLTYQRYTHGGR